MAQKYTDEQKTAVLARASVIGVLAAAAEAGIPWKKVSKWNKAAITAQADEKTDIAQDLPAQNDVEAEAATFVDADAAEMKMKKKAEKAARKAKEKKEAAKAKAEKAFKKARAAKMNLIFESNNGMQITLKALTDKIPEGCDAAYVKTEENRIYWVKGEETGFEDIW